MKKNFIFLLTFISISFHSGSLTFRGDSSSHISTLESSASKIKEGSGEDILEKFPLYFIENKGQVDERVRYQVKLSSMNVYFTSEEIIYQSFHREDEKAKVENIRMEFLGMNEEVQVEGVGESGGKVNYFIGNDPERWVQGARTYEKVIYRELYPDIDLVVYGGREKIKHEYRVKAGGEVEDIRIKYEGVKILKMSEEGALEIGLKGGELREGNPVSFQKIDGKRVEVGSGYRVKEDNVIGFRVADYRKDRELIIDPELSYSTYLGGSSEESGWEGMGIEVDGSGSVYVAGNTWSHDFPTTPGAYDTSNSGNLDVFITKLDSTGSGLSYSTYLGGSSHEYSGGIAIDGNGNAYVTGQTDSTDFPTTPAAYDTSLNGCGDVFVTKLNSTGTVLVYSTYLGGSTTETANGIAIDGSGNAYVTGQTESYDYPTTFSAYDTTYNAGGSDVFVTKLNSTGTALSYSTFLGGGDYDAGNEIEVDGIGSAYVTGQTASTDFPTTPGAYDTSLDGGSDAFITKLNATGSVLSYSTYLGGSAGDTGWGIAVDGSGNAYVTGATNIRYLGDDDVFITKLNSTGSALFYYNYVGGSAQDCGFGISVDSIGNAYVAGFTGSSNFPTTPGAYDTSYNGGYHDVFILKLNSTGSVLSYSTYLGGSRADEGWGIAADKDGNAYVAGDTSSIDFPTTPGAYDTSHNGGYWDVFVAKFCLGRKDDLIGTWSAGVWYRDSAKDSWVLMSTPAQMITAGDLDGDGSDDLLGVWSSGLWVKYSSSGSWAKLSTTLPIDIASGDMEGDGRDDILGSWASGLWYRNSDTGSWVLMSNSHADLVAAGDLDGDGTDDLIGVWSSGLWVKYSSTNSWLLATSVLPASIASGDMNGDGRDDILGTWTSGVWYKASMTDTWVKMCSSPANLVAAGDIDGDGVDDLIGTWSSGLWVKNSSTTSWQSICASLPYDIDAGLFRTGWSAGAVNYDSPMAGVYAEGPGSIIEYEDLTSEGPGGWNFVYQEEENLMPQEARAQRMMRIPGPGETGLKSIEQKNLVPVEKIKNRNNEMR